MGAGGGAAFGWAVAAERERREGSRGGWKKRELIGGLGLLAGQLGLAQKKGGEARGNWARGLKKGRGEFHFSFFKHIFQMHFFFFKYFLAQDILVFKTIITNKMHQHACNKMLF